jgi:tripartite ATP-independent transporter DctM subunit
MLILFGIFFILLILGVPIAFCMFGSSIVYMIVYRIPIEMAVQRLASGPDSFPLLAVSFFIMFGILMNNAGLTKRIFDFADKLVGHLTGGLAHANVLASVIFAGMSGSAIADSAGLGAIELKAMKENGYDESFSLAVTGASSIIGPIIPPSVPAVIFGVTAGASIGRLFAAGFIPGLMMSFGFCVLNYILCIKKVFYKNKKRATLREVVISAKKAAFPLLTPVIIIGGIMGGVVTPTEASVVAVIYAFILGIINRQLNVENMVEVFKYTLNVTVGVLFIIASATLFSWLLTLTLAPQKFSLLLLGLVHDKFLTLLVINIILLVTGLFIDVTPAIIIMVPILLPTIIKLGIDPVQFGIIVIVSLMIGLLTPPVGMVLYALSNISKVSFETIARSLAPYICICVVFLLLITYIPQISLFLPNLLFK